jgi:hypothetical protein
MKRLAIVDPWLKSTGGEDALEHLIEEFTARNVHPDVAMNLSNFERKYGKIEEYDGLLIHPGLRNQSVAFRELIKRALKIPIAIGSWSPEDYKKRGNIAGFRYEQIDQMMDYFSFE